MKPIAILSDIHGNKWSTFSKVNPDGVNSRLQIVLDEIDRAARELEKMGGRDIIIAGDTFHVRGSIDPEVLNPMQRTIQRLMDDGFNFHAIPGNHDLASKETTELGSSIQTLAQTFSMNGVFRVYNETTIVPIGGHFCAFVPWFSTTESLLKALEKLKTDCGVNFENTNVIMHAGIDGVIPNLPGHGLTVDILKDFGFRAIFSGHYHNRKHLGHNVWSIGATAHQKWNCVGTKAGFIILDADGKVNEFDSHAPKFIDVSTLSTDDMELVAPGNYVRFRGPPMTQKEVANWRSFFENAGALGISIEAPVAIASARAASPATTAKKRTVDESALAFVDKMPIVNPNLDREAIKRGVADVLTTVRSVSTAA